MSQKDKPRLTRLFTILIQLQSKRIVTAQELSEKHGVSVRTIYRDIRTLEASGIPIITEEGRGYSLVEGFRMPPLSFTTEESNALVTAEQLMALNKDASIAKAYESAMHKVRSILKYDDKESAALLAQRIVFRANDEKEYTSELVGIIQTAITDFQVLFMKYASLEGQESSRYIEPFALYHTHENWLLIAYCRLRKAFRSFRVDQIKVLRRETEHFESHKMTLSEYFEQT